MFDFFLLGPYCLFGHRITHINMMWVHKNKVYGALIFVRVARFESYGK
jgi:hypothetical protein